VAIVLAILATEMSQSEEERDGDNLFDQLRSIKAFTVDQLYLLHPDVCCPPTSSHNDYKSTSTNTETHHDQILYQNLVEYEELRDKLI